ncbi:MAG: LysE family translocator [Drouetiella hepatica Uher 2000/2452]|jgi:threonine/homoserine/homoserine lactone efflux protein|uniref:LysE family translocator n=1 Tax=Drouetiella hepatica Uher 2000/2452 TaxID=904376 RepID=A0A951UMF5_9CYAN|nr:LysE family translocator [Drouetiella hepatica Uher 2000/2452]
MDLYFYGRGLLIGFSIAAPVGPIGILAIRRTLTLGKRAGLVTGLGAATADAIYGCIAGFGLTAVSDLLLGQAFWLKLVGGLFLCYLGVKTFISHPAEETGVIENNRAYWSMYTSTVLLTLTSPATILSFAAVFVGLGLATMGGNYTTAAVLVAGVFSGSALWWLLLSSGADLLRGKFTPQRLRGLNRISGLILLTFGIIALSARN